MWQWYCDGSSQTSYLMHQFVLECFHLTFLLFSTFEHELLFLAIFWRTSVLLWTTGAPVLASDEVLYLRTSQKWVFFLLGESGQPVAPQKDLHVLQKLKKDTFKEKPKAKHTPKYSTSLRLYLCTGPWCCTNRELLKGSTQTYREHREYSDQNETKRSERLFVCKS